ncbi:MAG: TlpA family protein disulfide reductase [Actinomycetota bacterium]|nr:TlpA family protein disulfide reductase [Actinomycetota bacterium]
MIIAQRIRIVVGLAALALSFSANGVSGATGTTTDDTAAEEDPCSPATSTEASSPEASSPEASAPQSSADDGATAAGEFLPDIEVVRVACGDTVGLRSLAEPGVPTLLWFWAPHCTFCMREAPEVVEFSAEYGDEVRIIGLGAQDSLDQAVDFVSSTGTEGLDMVWDESGESWIPFEVTSQPTVIVLSADGEVEETWYRDFDEAGILAAAGLT